MLSIVILAFVVLALSLCHAAPPNSLSLGIVTSAITFAVVGAETLRGAVLIAVVVFLLFILLLVILLDVVLHLCDVSVATATAVVVVVVILIVLISL